MTNQTTSLHLTNQNGEFRSTVTIQVCAYETRLNALKFKKQTYVAAGSEIQMMETSSDASTQYVITFRDKIELLGILF